MKKPLYSVILPIRNEEESLPQLFKELNKGMRSSSYEIIAVDDASTDSTYATLKIITKQRLPVRIIHLPRHLGKWAALRAGLAVARGDIIITMDADLQDDPQELPKLLGKLDDGYDIVSGWRKHRIDPFYKSLMTRIANLAYGFHDFASPMKVYRRSSLKKLPHEGSLLRYSYLFAHKLGLHAAEIPVAHRRRMYGKSKFGVQKYFRIFWDMILITLLFSGSGRLKSRI